jgi:hypothetical protein
MIRSRLTPKFGIVLEAEPGDELNRIETAQIREWLLERHGGVVLFRGFPATEESFRSFTERHGTEFVVHHNLMARDYVKGDPTLATVNKGDYAIDFHNEMASDPISPDVFWMFACNPARAKGRTGLVDGAVVASELTPKTRRLFSEKPFLFECNRLPRSLWGALLPGRTSRQQVSEWLSSTGAKRGVTHFEFDDEDQLSFRFGYHAIRRSRLSGITAFCCGILDSPETYRFDDGSSPDSPFIVEVSQAAHQNAVWLDWRQGDLVIIDNTRIMHAREAFDDADRRILVRYSALR